MSTEAYKVIRTIDRLFRDDGYGSYAYSIDLEDELREAMATEITAEIDAEILRSIYVSE